MLQPPQGSVPNPSSINKKVLVHDANNNKRRNILFISRRELTGLCVRTTVATLSTSSVIVASCPFPAHAIMYENGPTVQSTRIKIGSTGVTYQDLRPGDGDVVEEGKRVNIQWVLKRSNGYDIDASSNNDGVPFIFVVGSSTTATTTTITTSSSSSNNSVAIPGLDLGIRGMKVGGIRRIVIPPNMAFVDGVEDDKAGPVPRGFGPKQRARRVMELLKDVPDESFVLDVKATLVK